MSASVQTRTDDAATTVSSTYRLSFPRLVRSEAVKLFTLRSTWWSLGVTVVLAVGISLLFAWALSGSDGGFDPVSAVLIPTQFTMLVAGILGAMAVTGEYSTGMIRSTLTAEPRRGTVLLAKALVVAATLAVTTIVTSALSILAVTPFLGDSRFAWDDADRTWIPLALGVFVMATYALLGLGWGFIIRNGAGAIAATVGILFVLPIILSIFTIGGEAWAWIVELGDYLPSNAGAAVAMPGDREGFVPALISVIAWPLAALVAGWAVLRGRDA